MATTLDKLEEQLETPYGVNVYYFASTEPPLLREAASLVRMAIADTQNSEEATRIDGPVPNMGEVIAASGAISFFGTPRLVELREISPTTMGDKDIDELCALFGDLQNALLLVTALYKDKKAESSKKSKRLFEAASKAGFAAAFAKPTRRDTLAYIQKQAAALGARYLPGAAEALLERAGDNRPLLANETAKLAAISNYEGISVATVEQYGVHNIEADVFALARAITSGQRATTYRKLDELLSQRHEPVAITVALAGVFIDMYRVRCATEQNIPIPQVFKEMGYRGNDYRLKKAKENAARYTTTDIERGVLCLEGLDASLKSSALLDKTLLLEAAVGRLLALGRRR